MSNMKNESNVTFSFVFRVTQMSTEIDPATRRLLDPVVGPKKAKQYRDGQRHFQTELYHKQMEELVEKMDNFFVRHKI